MKRQTPVPLPSSASTDTRPAHNATIPTQQMLRRPPRAIPDGPMGDFAGVYIPRPRVGLPVWDLGFGSGGRDGAGGKWYLVNDSVGLSRYWHGCCVLYCCMKQGFVTHVRGDRIGVWATRRDGTPVALPD